MSLHSVNFSFLVHNFKNALNTLDYNVLQMISLCSKKPAQYFPNKKGGFSAQIVRLPVDFNAALSLGVDAMLVETIGLAQSGGGASEARGRGRNSLPGCFLPSQRETQSGKVNDYLRLTPRTHTSLLFTQVNTLTHSHKLNFSSDSDTINNSK